MRLKAEPVAAVELIDRAGLASVTGKPGMPDFLASLGPDATALLVEIQGADEAEIASSLKAVSAALIDAPPARPFEFTSDPYLIEKYWKLRKGLFPAVGAVRPAGTTVIIEDVAVPIDRLAAATADLQARSRGTATGKRSFSVMRSMGTCISFSRRASPIRRRSSATRP